jgi:hypothetical protein
VDLRHGYILDDVNGLSIWAVLHDRYHPLADFDDRLEVAWHAMIEHIYTSVEPPLIPEVIRAGWRAIAHHVKTDEHFHRGYGRDRDAVTNKGFDRYWLDTGQPASGPEERVTEYVALAQIWARLRPKDRELLAAMAEHEDYAQAAAALGKTRHAYATDIGKARKAFRALWHEGETPSRPWGADRRASKPDSPKMRVTYRLIVRRRAAQTRASARQASGRPCGSESAARPQERS